MFRLDLSGIIIMLFAILAPIQTTMLAIAFLLIADFLEVKRSKEGVFKDFEIFIRFKFFSLFIL